MNIRALLSIGRGSRSVSGPDGQLRRAGLAAAAMSLVCVVGIALLAHSYHEGRADRSQARTPVFAAAHPDQPAAGQWLDAEGETGRNDGVRLAVVYLRQLRPSQPPPGIPRWPRPGEYFASPAADGLGTPVLGRYGTRVGGISPEGVLNAGERLVYVGPPAAVRMPADSYARMLSFGGSGQWALPSETDRPLDDIYWLLLGFAAGPLLVLCIVTARSGSAARDRRLALLHTLGARASQRWLVVAGEAWRPIAGGGLAGLGLLSVAALVDVPVPGTHFVMPAADTRAGLPLVAVAAVAAALGFLLLTVALNLRRGTQLRTRPRPGPERTRSAAGWVFPAALVVASSATVLPGGTLPSAAFVVGLVGAVVSVALTAGALASRLGASVAAHGGPSSVVGGRWLEARPATSARLAAGLVVALIVLTQVQVFDSRLNGSGPEQPTSSSSTPHVTSYQVGGSSRRVAMFYRDVGRAGGTAFVTNESLDRLVGSCEALRRLGARQCPSSWAPTGAVFGDARSFHDFRTTFLTYVPGVRVRAAQPPAQLDDARLYVVNPPGDRGADRVQAIVHRHLLVYDSTSVGDTVSGEVVEASWFPWVAWAGILALAAMVLAGSVANASTFVQLSRDLGPVAYFVQGGRFYRRLSGVSVTAPVVVGVVLGTAAAVWLGFLNASLMGEGATMSVTFVASVTLTAIVAAAGLGVASAGLAARALRGWRPQGD